MSMSSADVPSKSSKPRVSAAPAPASEPEVEPTPEPVSTSATSSADLAPASESSEAGVQALLAQRQTASAVGDDEAAAEVTERLAELGYR